MGKESNHVFRIRAELGLTQEALGEMLGVSKNYIYLMETGRKPVSDLVRLKLDSFRNQLTLSPGSLPSDEEISQEFTRIMERPPFRLTQPERISQNLYRAWIAAGDPRRRAQLETLSTHIVGLCSGGDAGGSAEQAKSVISKIAGAGK